MATIKTKQATDTNPSFNLFNKDNFMWMLIGLAIMAIGFFLMAGGKSLDPKIFNDNEIYSFRRITLAPIFILAGLILEIYAIIKKPKTS